MRSFAPSLNLPRARPAIEVPRLAVTLLLWVIPIVAIGVVAVRRWTQIGSYPSGFDEGSWLAFGRGFFGGRSKSTSDAYPPLIPMVLHVGRLLVGPMLASKLVGLGSLIAIMVAIYLIARLGMNPWIAAMMTVLAGLGGELTETVAFGGYPQNYAIAFIVLSAGASALYLASGTRRHLIMAAAALVGAALSHHMYFGVACIVVVVIWAIWLTTIPSRPVAIQRTLRLAGAGIVAVLAFLPTFIKLELDGYSPPVNASGWTLGTAFRFGLREGEWFWIAMIALAVASLALTVRRRREATWQVAAAMMLTAGALFPPTAELRLLPPLVIGASLGVGLGLQDLWRRSRHLAWGGVPLAVALALPLFLWPHSDAAASELYGYYRMADASLLHTTAFIQQHRNDGIVVVDQDLRTWPVGWWFEGLTTAKIAVGSPDRWLAFPGERSNAHLASQFFDQKLTSAQAADLAAQHGVRYLVFYKYQWIGWEAWQQEAAPRVKVVYDDDEFMVVDVAPR